MHRNKGKGEGLNVSKRQTKPSTFNSAQCTPQWFCSLCIPFVIILSVMLWGTYRLFAPETVPEIKVGLLALPVTLQEQLSKNSIQAFTATQQLIAALPALKQQGAQIIVTPEKMLTLTDENHTDILKRLESAAHQLQLTLVIGVNQHTAHVLRNIAWVITPEGVMHTAYIKQHLLKPFEQSYVQGQALGILSMAHARFGLAICKDMDFINPALAYAQAGVGVLLVPALDFNLDALLHAKPALVRGVEGGYSVVRVAQWGLLQVSDPEGRVLASEKTSATDHVGFVVNVPIGKGHTFYSRIGNSFAWICLFIFLWLIIFCYRKWCDVR